MNARFLTIMVCCVPLLFTSTSHAEPRTWKNKNGKTLKGELIEKKKTTLIIQKGEQEVTVKIDDLSDDDKKYLDDLTPYVGFECERFEHWYRMSLPKSPQELREKAVAQLVLAQKQKLPMNQAFIVTEVTAGSPADNAGVKAGYIFTKAGGKTFSTTQNYINWNKSTFTKSRAYTFLLPTEKERLRNTEIQISPQWWTPEQFAAEKVAKAAEETAKIEAAKKAEEQALADKAAAEKARQDAEWEAAGGEFQKAVVEFIKPTLAVFSQKEETFTTEEKDSFAAFAQKSIKAYLKFKHDAIFNDDVKVQKLSAGLPDNQSLVWWMVSGTVKAPNALGTFLTHEYEVWSVEEDDSPKAVYITLGEKCMHIDTQFTGLLRKRRESQNAVALYMLFITKEKEYKDTDYTPDFEALDTIVLFNVKRLFIETQKIALEMVIEPSIRTPGDQLTMKYLGNHVYEIRCKDVSYTKYGDEIYTSETLQKSYRYLHELTWKRISFSLTPTQKEIWWHAEEIVRQNLDENAVVIDSGIMSYTAKLQHHPGSKGIEWTLIEPPRITKMESKRKDDK